MRDELLAIEQFDPRLEAQVLVDGRTDYNTYRPNSALGMLTPAQFARWLRWPELQFRRVVRSSALPTPVITRLRWRRGRRGGRPARRGRGRPASRTAPR